MSVLRLAGLCLLLVTATGCATPATEGDEAIEVDASELRALTPEEILGQIHYGDMKSIPYTSEPRYRAYWFEGKKGEWLDVKVSSSNGSVGAFVTDDQFRAVRRGTQAVLPKNGKYFIAVRDWELEPATLTISFRLHTLPSH